MAMTKSSLRSLQKKREKIEQVMQEKQSEYDSIQKLISDYFVEKNKEQIELLGREVSKAGFEVSASDRKAILEFLRERKSENVPAEKKAAEPKPASVKKDAEASSKKTAEVPQNDAKEQDATEAKQGENPKEDANSKEAESVPASDEPVETKSVDVSISSPNGIQKDGEGSNTSAPNIQSWSPSASTVF